MTDNVAPLRPRTQIGMAAGKPVEATWEFVKWLEQLRTSAIVGETGADSAAILPVPLAAYAGATGGSLGLGAASYAGPAVVSVAASYAVPAGLPIPFPAYT